MSLSLNALQQLLISRLVSDRPGTPDGELTETLETLLSLCEATHLDPDELQGHIKQLESEASEPADPDECDSCDRLRNHVDELNEKLNQLEDERDAAQKNLDDIRATRRQSEGSTHD